MATATTTIIVHNDDGSSGGRSSRNCNNYKRLLDAVSPATATAGRRPLSLWFWFWTTIMMMSFMWKSSSGGSSISSSSSITVTLDSLQQQLQHKEQLLVSSGAFFTVDGGYDQHQGDQPICWQAQTILPVSSSSSSSSSTNNDNKSQNPLPPQSSYFDNNSNSGPGTTSTARISPFFSLFPSCPKGTQLQVHLLSRNNNKEKTGADMQEEKQLELLPDGTWMGLTDVAYEYIVHGTVDLNQWVNVSTTTMTSSSNNTNNNNLYNGNNPLKIGISMILCSIEQVRFCSPFLHYDTTTTATTIGGDIQYSFGALHGSTHIDSDIQYATLGSDSTFSAPITVKVQEPGAFSIVVGAFFYYAVDDTTTTASNSTTQPPQQYYYNAAQIANAAKDYPVIAFWRVRVSRPARLAAYVFIAASGFVLLVLLLYTLRHRKSQVLNLTHGNSLIALLMFSLLTTVAAVTLEPRNSLYCYLQGPLVVLPMHILFAVLLGRLWRIQALISHPLLITLERNDTWSDRFVEYMRRITALDTNNWKKGCRYRGATAATATPSHQPHGSNMNSVRSSWIHSVWNRKRGGGDGNNGNHPSAARPTASRLQRPLRCKVTGAQFTRFVAIFSLPQVVVQIVYLIYGQEHLVNGVCPTDFFHSPTNGIGGIVLFLLVVLLLSLARSSKDVPSLFNENEAMWDMSFLSLVLLGMACTVTIITNSPTTKPDIRYLVETLTVVVITTNTCFKIVLPKLRKIWRNEKVIVSKLVFDHFRMERKKANGGVEYIPQERGGNHHHHEQQQDGDDYKTIRRHDIARPVIANNHVADSPPNNHLCSPRFADDDDEEDSIIERPSAPPMVVEEPLNHGQKTSTLQSIPVEELPDDPGFSRCNHERYRRSTFGLPSQSSMLSSPSHNIPEHASIQSAFNDRIPSSADSVPASEPAPSAARIARASRIMNGRRGPHASIVRNRATMSLSSKSIRQTRKSCSDMPSIPTSLAASPTSAGNAGSHHAGSTRFSVFRPKIDKRNVQHLDIAVNPKKRAQPIHVSVDGDTDEPLSRRLLLPMIDVHHTLGLVNRALLSGDQVMREDWEFLRECVVALGRMFEEEVVFDWEPINDESYGLDVPASDASAPFARGSDYPSTIYANRERPPSYVPPGGGQVSFASSTGSRPPSQAPGANTSNTGTDAVAPSSSIAGSPEVSAPFLRDRLSDRVVREGGIISNILQKLPRPHSGHRHLRRPASLENSNNRRQQHEIHVRRASVQQPLSIDTCGPVPGPTILETIQSSDIDKDNDANKEVANKEVDNMQGDSVNESPMGFRILPRSGRSSPRSQFHAGDGVGESFTSVDSLASGLSFNATMSTATSPPPSIVARRTSTTLRRQHSQGLIGSFSASPRSSTVGRVTIQILSSTFLSDSGNYQNADNSDENNRDVSDDQHGPNRQCTDEEDDKQEDEEEAEGLPQRHVSKTR